MKKEAILAEPVSAQLPILPLRDVVVFPHMIVPLFVGRGPSVLAVESAMQSGKEMLTVMQTESDKVLEYPVAQDLHKVGSRIKILQKIQLPDASLRVLVEGTARSFIEPFEEEKHLWSHSIPFYTEPYAGPSVEEEAERRALLKIFGTLVKRTKRYPLELYERLERLEDLSVLTDSMAAALSSDIAAQQAILEASSITERVTLLHQLLAQELDFFELEQRVQDRVKSEVDKSQRQYYLSAKIKALQDELSDIGEGYNPADEIAELEQAIYKAGMSKEATLKAEQELKKLRMMSPASAEATVSRSYIDTLLALPWKKRSRLNVSIKNAEKILDEEHYGLKEVKERIIEYLAVQKRVKKIKGSILCLVGPPGVGKTSLGASIARATGRGFARIALGGVRDEAEIRGHRRTYIGAMPGKIIQRMMKLKVKNPVFMLDEVDKMAMDFRGDPASALLEVLDPEQNNSFNDHYLEIDYDLSEVMFIATANSMNIPAPLLDRMEIIRLSGYTEEEKLHIAERYLVPRQQQFSGLAKEEVHITEGALLDIIRCYTREAGVRSLEREVSKILRKVVKEAAYE